jgi:iron complex transport system substrate-binding protein
MSPRPRPTAVRTAALAVALTAAVTAAAACGGDDDTEAGARDPAAAGTDPGAEFPVTVENCGEETTYDAPPERAVVIYQHTTEIMLALGLEDRMVGTAYMDSAIRDDLADAYGTVPEMAEQAPSREQVLAAEPDIVVAGWPSAFEDGAAGSRESLAELGVDSYLSTGSCPDFAGEPSLDLVREDVTEIAAVFGVPDRAAELLATIEGPIADVEATLAGADPVDVFVYDSGSDQAFTTGGRENTTALVELAGGRNVFADVDDDWVEVSWEDVVAREPDVVLVLDYGDETVEQKEEFLRSHPVASTLAAVRDGRFVVAELTDVVPGIRNGDVVAAMAEGFHPDRAG